MNSLITLEGIDQAIAALNPHNSKSLKSKLVGLIREFYENEDSLKVLQGIPSEELIKRLWNTGPASMAIKSKVRNLNSIKSSVNIDLQKLYREGRISQGIIIGATNVFQMSAEAKDKFLSDFADSGLGKDSADLGEIAGVLNVVDEMLSVPGAVSGKEHPDRSKKLKEVQNLVRDLSQKLGLSAGAQEADETGFDEAAEDVEEVEVEEELDEDLEEMEEEAEVDEETDAVVEVEDDLEEVQKNQLLAEKFHDSLGAMDRFYNQYIRIPAGKYIVGAQNPGNKVHLASFFIGKFPVTNALYEIFVEETGYATTAERFGYGTVYFGRYQKETDALSSRQKLIWNSSQVCKTVKGACWYQPRGPGSTIHGKRNHPVVQVSLEDAMAFAAWTGKRLPTEAEWEAAARTSRGYDFPWGELFKAEACNIEQSGIGDTTVVDAYADFANDYGIVDALGNVLEWTTDSCESSGVPQTEIQYKILKGGSWLSAGELCLSDRLEMDGRKSSNILGFRCVAF